MMKKFKAWLVQRFLPAYAKQTILRENEQLKQQITELRAEIDRLNSYIDGMKDNMKSQRRIIINTGGTQK